MYLKSENDQYPYHGGCILTTTPFLNFCEWVEFCWNITMTTGWWLDSLMSSHDNVVHVATQIEQLVSNEFTCTLIDLENSRTKYKFGIWGKNIFSHSSDWFRYVTAVNNMFGRTNKDWHKPMTFNKVQTPFPTGDIQIYTLYLMVHHLGGLHWMLRSNMRAKGPT